MKFHILAKVPRSVLSKVAEGEFPKDWYVHIRKWNGHHLGLAGDFARTESRERGVPGAF